MASASSHSYKQYNRNQRRLVMETLYNRGMKYTDAPLPDGQIRVAMNLIQMDYGDTLRPRGGWRNIIPPLMLGSNLGELYIHHSSTCFIEDAVTHEVFLRRYALILTKSVDGEYGSLENSRIIIDDPEAGNDVMHVSTPQTGITNYLIKHDSHAGVPEVHDMDLSAASPTGYHGTVEGNTYLLTPDGLGRLEITFNQGVYTHKVSLVVPLEIDPSMAINYGYNMLAADPYLFDNVEGPTLTLQSIIPYDRRTDTLKHNAKFGENVRFRLVYEYKLNESYKVQWEVQDISQQSGIRVLQKKEDSPTYTNGADIYIDFPIDMREFSVQAIVYPAADLTSSLRTLSFPMFTMSNTETYKFTMQEFDMMSAEGMTVWKSQIVYWGVDNADMALFVSEVRDPTYVPFPNNAIGFDEKVLRAFPYMEDLFVITERAMYLVSFAEMGFSTKPVQMNLQLQDSDYMAMYPVRNMVYFKNHNYYYMVVPNTKNDRGELQIAPINIPISALLDDFKFQAYKILADTYTLTSVFSAGRDTLDHMVLVDYASYSDGNRLRNVYKIEFDVGGTKYYIDFHLVYDTIGRAWHIEAMQSNKNRLHLFQAIATGYAQFLNLHNNVDELTGDIDHYISWVNIDESDIVDNFALDDAEPRVIQNYQMLDTGKRGMDGFKKKRFRHAIIEINNTSNEDIAFNHALMIDDQVRNSIFKYDVEHVIDPLADNFGQIYVTRDFTDPDYFEGVEFTDPDVVRGITALGAWVLSTTSFPERTMYKVHLTMSGKGYYPRLIMMTRSSKSFELTGMGWAYRDMNAR